MRVLFIGEIVGKAGVFCIKSKLKALVQENDIDFVVANGDGTTGGMGMGKNHSIYLRKLGIDVITTGEAVFYKKDMVPHLPKAPYILRAANYPPQNPGRGWRVYTKGDKKLAVISLMGQAGFNRVHLSNPFTFLPELVSRAKQETNAIILDFHAATTAEKRTMFYHADGTLSAIFGTHGRALTSDAEIMEKGTFVITDTGRTGSVHSVYGLDPEIELKKFLTSVPERQKETWNTLELQGCILDINSEGKAESFEVLKLPCEEETNEGNSSGN
ncbi:MAG: YmdB family metallophosphoesterase [Spirochaetia bacterium]